MSPVIRQAGDMQFAEIHAQLFLLGCLLAQIAGAVLGHRLLRLAEGLIEQDPLAADQLSMSRII
jgi:hypothetical protein